MTLNELQRLIDAMYGDKDRRRGATATYLWLAEEIGELASAIREHTACVQAAQEQSREHDSPDSLAIQDSSPATTSRQVHEELAREFADVLAWLVTLANVCDVDLTAAVHAKYGTGCPGCGRMICICNGKP